MSEDISEQVDGQQPPPLLRLRKRRDSGPSGRPSGSNRYVAMLDDASLFLQDLQEEKQEEFNERSERWRESEKGEAAEEQIRLLEEAIEYIGQAQFLLDGYGG
jgi:hypothetical protein